MVIKEKWMLYLWFENTQTVFYVWQYITLQYSIIVSLWGFQSGLTGQSRGSNPSRPTNILHTTCKNHEVWSCSFKLKSGTKNNFAKWFWRNCGCTKKLCVIEWTQGGATAGVQTERNIPEKLPRHRHQLSLSVAGATACFVSNLTRSRMETHLAGTFLLWHFFRLHNLTEQKGW